MLIEEGKKRKLLDFVWDNPSYVESLCKHLLPDLLYNYPRRPALKDELNKLSLNG
jgi:hypothetical protein